MSEPVKQPLKKVTVRREHEGQDPNGNPFNGLWVARDGDGNFIEFTQWSNDLRGRYTKARGYDLQFIREDGTVDDE